MADSLPDHDSILSRETTPGRPSYPYPLTPEPDVKIDGDEYFSCDGDPDGDNDDPDGDNDGPGDGEDPPGREETPLDSMYFSDSEDVSSASDDDVSQYTAYFEHN